MPHKISLKHLIYLGCLVLSLLMMPKIAEISSIWQSKITQQSAVLREAKQHDQKLSLLRKTTMVQWDNAFDALGDNRDMVSLSRRLNVKETALTPVADVSRISANERVLHSIGNKQIALGLRRICFGQGQNGFAADARNISSMLLSLKELEKRPSIDFDRFTLTTQENGVRVNIYDLCVDLKES